MPHADAHMPTVHRSIAVRRKWLFNTVREIQVAIIVWHDAEALHRQLARIRRPHTPVEALILRGLIAQLDLHRRAAAPTLLRWQQKPDLSVAERAKRLIDTKYTSLTSVERIAREVGCHPVHLERVFRRTYDTTVHRYLRMVRVEAGLSLLTHTTIKIEAIPHLVGFKGKGTFYRAIQETTGHTPGYLRQRSATAIA